MLFVITTTKKGSALIFFILSFIILLLGCSRYNPPPPTPQSSETAASPTPTATPLPPSPTPVPLAARVNNLEITLAQYQAELERYKMAVGTELATEDQHKVLDDLINQALLAQSAQEKGFVADDQMIQTHIDRLINQLGNPQSLTDWMAKNGFTDDSFRSNLKLALEAAWMRDQIIAQTPSQVEQVHARQILLYTAAQANETLAQLKSGKNFAELAAQYDPVTYGDLGWFPRGYLLNKKLEEVAFNLQPGSFSEVIETEAGFHILLVVEKDPSRPLEPDMLLTLQTHALENWLQQQRNQAKIEILLPESL